MRAALVVAVVVLLAPQVAAGQALHTERTEYKDGEVVLDGYLAHPKALSAPAPAVLVVHDWMGPSDHYRGVAEDLARLGYVAFALDIYGKGNAPTDRKSAGATAGKYKNDRALFRRRLAAGLAAMLACKHADPKRVAAIGYCFGGTGVLELARSGAAVAGVVSFHGGLETPTPEDAKNIKGKVLVLHGDADASVTPEKVAAFTKEMRDAKVDWQLVTYADAVHGFSKPGNRYNANAARRSWAHMQLFFRELFPAPAEK